MDILKKRLRPSRKFDVSNFKEFTPFDENTTNGFYFNGIYIPEEVLSLILTCVDDDILKYTLVCKSWCNIIKSFSFWARKYKRRYGKKAKKLPWYIYYCLIHTDFFDTNLLKNNCGEKKYQHWQILKNYGDQFKIENPPSGSDALPKSEDFNGNTSCFATSYYECSKKQEINLFTRPIYSVILNTYKPEIYISEWVAGRFDCGCQYTLTCILYDKLGQVIDMKEATYSVEQFLGREWTKVSISFKDYKEGARKLIFQHEGQDTQFWKGHYGSKMAGGVVKILFDSINSIEN